MRGGDFQPLFRASSNTEDTSYDSAVRFSIDEMALEACSNAEEEALVAAGLMRLPTTNKSDEFLTLPAPQISIENIQPVIRANAMKTNFIGGSHIVIYSIGHYSVKDVHLPSQIAEKTAYFVLSIGQNSHFDQYAILASCQLP